MNAKSRTSVQVSAAKSPQGRVERLSSVASESVRKLSSLVHMHDEGFAVTTEDYSDLPLIKDKLNSEEKKLFDEDPAVGARVLLHALTATDTAKDLYDTTVLHNGNGDAYRHMYWNFRMASNSSIGASWAERWGNAHEDGDPTAPSIERTMDLHNNLRGRQLAAANVDDDPRALRAGIRNGSCRIIKNGTLVKSNSDGEKP
jgi:hypothetical protein